MAQVSGTLSRPFLLYLFWSTSYFPRKAMEMSLTTVAIAYLILFLVALVMGFGDFVLLPEAYRQVRHLLVLALLGVGLVLFLLPPLLYLLQRMAVAVGCGKCIFNVHLRVLAVVGRSA
jgi:hypothetical protein